MITRYTDRALTEIDLGILWYEEQKRGLGSDFLDCVEAAVKTFQKTQRCIKKGIHISGAARSDVSPFLFFIRLKILKL